MSLSTREIEAVLKEIRPALVRAHLREVAQLDRESFAFRFRTAGEERYFCLCATPGLSRLHLLSAWPEVPKSKHPFFLFLKSHLADAPLESIEQLQGDRIVELRFAGEEPLRLVAELTGSLTNLVCVSPQGEILEALRHMRLRDREIFPHTAYQLPPPPGRVGDAAMRDRFIEAPSRSAAIEAAYAKLGEEQQAKELRGQLASILNDAEKKAARKLANIERSLDVMRNAAADRQKGELLKGHLADIPRGAANVLLPDASGEPVSIQLDPKLPPLENMRRYFERYKKEVAGLAQTEQRLAETRAALDHLRRVHEALDAAENVEALDRVRADMAAARLIKAPKRRGAPPASAEPRRFLSAEGFDILVGRSNEQNDHLTLHLARGNDLWLHVQTIPGSHVIVRTPPGKTVPKETLLDAAHLAVYYSKARTAKGVFVDYVPRKHVRKPKGSPPGYVTYAHNKTLIIDPDPERIRRVLAASATDVGSEGEG